MSKANKKKKEHDGDDKRSDSSIFYIMDGIIDQLNKTKKLFIIMLLTIMIIPPIAFMLSFVLFGFPFYDDNNNHGNWLDNGRPWTSESSPNPNADSDFNPQFRFLPLIPIVIVLIWLGIGIRQWFVLSKWDKRYKKYKELQKKIDEELEKKDDNDKFKSN